MYSRCSQIVFSLMVLTFFYLTALPGPDALPLILYIRTRLPRKYGHGYSGTMCDELHGQVLEVFGTGGSTVRRTQRRCAVTCSAFYIYGVLITFSTDRTSSASKKLTYFVLDSLSSRSSFAHTLYTLSIAYSPIDKRSPFIPIDLI